LYFSQVWSGTECRCIVSSDQPFEKYRSCLTHTMLHTCWEAVWKVVAVKLTVLIWNIAIL
jgi:hypothetical protein